MMKDIMLGTVVIADDYTLLSFNDGAKAALPAIDGHGKCYEVLLGRDKPCDFCPVFKREHTQDEPSDKNESIVEAFTVDGRTMYIISFIIDKCDNCPELSCIRYNLDNTFVSKALAAAKGWCSRSDDESAREIDKATGLYTIQAFIKYARKLLHEYPEESFNILITDIKNFQLITATYGESKAQELLEALAEFMQGCYKNGIVAKYGIDQFVSIYPSPTLEKRVEIVKAFNKFKENSPIPNLTVKFGVYEHVDRNISITHMCSRALLALNTIIKDYRKNFSKYNDDLSQKQLRAQVYESRFEEALAHDEFVVWYQPKYNPFTEHMVGAEALVRWQTKEELIPPGEFLPVFEADGLIERLDMHVFRQVCAQQKKWQERGRQLFPISVNISRCSLFARDIVKKYKKIVEEFALDPDYVPIEITESVALENQMIKPIADTFIKEGFQLHMDDFGSGRSSLNGLNVMHFDAVKLDKSLIDFIGHKNGELILDYTMALGKELGVQLVAEGVETASQLQFLKDKGCDIIQGFYFSRPLPIADFEKKLAETGCDCDCHKLKACKAPHELMIANHLYSHMPGGFFSYEAFGEERILSSNSYLWEMFGFDNEDDFMEHVHGSFRGIVSPEELERVEDSIKQQIWHSDKDMDFVKYSIIHRDGRRIPVVDYGHLAHQDGKDIFYVFLYEERKQIN